MSGYGANNFCGNGSRSITGNFQNHRKPEQIVNIVPPLFQSSPSISNRYGTPSKTQSSSSKFVHNKTSSHQTIFSTSLVPPADINQPGPSSSHVRGLASNTVVSNTNRNQPFGTPTFSTFNNIPLEVFGSTQREKEFVFTGTVERVIRWNKIFRNHFCFFEVIGHVMSIQDGIISQQKIMLLRDKKGPILQVIYYETSHIDIQDFYFGKVLRCIGKMIGPNVLNAFCINSARDGEIANLERMCLICDQAVAHFLTV